MSMKPLAFVVEDDPALNDIGCLTLAPYFRVQSFLRGDLALEGLEKNIPDLVILDINIPNVSGGEILKKLRESERFSNTKVILTTADNVQAAMLDAEADIVLLKPVSTNQLRSLAVRISDTIEEI
jgi:DNA-binding response OmpR family regulator